MIRSAGEKGEMQSYRILFALMSFYPASAKPDLVINWESVSLSHALFTSFIS